MDTRTFVASVLRLKSTPILSIWPSNFLNKRCRVASRNWGILSRSRFCVLQEIPMHHMKCCFKLKMVSLSEDSSELGRLDSSPLRKVAETQLGQAENTVSPGHITVVLCPLHLFGGESAAFGEEQCKCMALHCPAGGMGHPGWCCPPLQEHLHTAPR